MTSRSRFMGGSVVSTDMVASGKAAGALHFGKLSGRAGEPARRMQEILLNLGMKPSHVKVAVERAEMTGEALPAIMRDFGFMGPEEVAEAVALQFNIKYFSPMQIADIVADDMRRTPMREFPGYVPAGFTPEGVLRVLVPDETRINDALNDFLDFRKEVQAASEHTIQAIYRRFYAATAEDYDALCSEFLAMLNSRTQEEDPGLLRNVFGQLLRHACYSGASDLYLYKSQAVGVAKLRIDGTGYVFRTMPFELYDRLVNLLIQETGVKVEELRREPREGYFSFNTDELRRRFSDIAHRYDFRVELAETRGQSRTVVIRIQDGQGSMVRLKSLGFDEETKQRLRRWISVSTGLVIVTGPTGSGKTTTLYALLGAIDPVERSIQSIENPIEVSKGLWMQYQPATEPGKEAEGAKKYLKAMLRQAPDVILMGETRDAEVASVLLDAAHTGHLAVSTLHTNSAAKALVRLRLMNVDAESLSSALQGILAQRLARKLCPHCSVPDDRESTAEVIRNATYIPAGATPKRAGDGCSHCNYGGHVGRVMIYETLDVTPKVRRLLERTAPLSEVVEAAFPRGTTMWGIGLRQVALGVISLDELQRVAESDDDILKSFED